MSDTTKLKHAYSLTSLSTRFLNGHGLHNAHTLTLSNGISNHNNNHLQNHHQSMLVTSSSGGHAKDSLDMEMNGSDDYGFLSFRDQDCSSKASGQLIRNNSFYSTSYLSSIPSQQNSNYLRQPSQNPQSLQQHGNPVVLVNGNSGCASIQSATSRGGCTGGNITKQKSCGSGSFSLCGCDCHGGLKFSKTELFRNHCNNGSSGSSSSTAVKLKRDSSSSRLNASSCQTLNLCSTNSNTCNGNAHHHNSHNNNSSISMYGSTLGMYSSSNNPNLTTNSNNNTVSNNNVLSSSDKNGNANIITTTTTAGNNSHANSLGPKINGNMNSNSASNNSNNNNNSIESRNKSSAVRVRRTLSCYAKNPTRNDILESNLTLAKEFTGSVNGVANCGINGGANNNNTLYPQIVNGSTSGSASRSGNNFANPICEFSPYSSLSSNDLLGLRLSNGYIEKRFSSSMNNGGHALTSVFLHDNPQDCGCPACFQTKLSILQANQKKPSAAIVNGINNNNNNKEDSSTSPITTNGSNTLSNSTVANYSCKTQDSDITWPLTPEESVGYFSSRLTSWELQEVSKYPQIWYLGQDAVRKINGDKTNPLNCGFDDENGNYHKVTRDHLAYRYEILEVIGKGSFGQVIRATDHKTQSQVAIKIIRNKKRFHAQALVEVKILEHLRKRDHDNTVIRMYSSFYFRNHLCIVFELMSLNLYELIRRNHYHGFSTGLIRKFAVSLLKCLALLKKENIIHCDLKPENILLRRRGSSAIKVIDFGSSCFGHERVFSYIQSRFYRAPEVILGIPYTTAIDIWSLGCVLAELSTGYPLFPGENEVEQLSCIMETLGLPSDSLITMATRRRLFFDSRNQPRCIRNSKGKIRRPGSKDLSTAIKSEDLDFISFLRKCLTWDPQERLSPNELLMEPWITSGANGVVTNTVSRKNYV